MSVSTLARLLLVTSSMFAVDSECDCLGRPRVLSSSLCLMAESQFLWKGSKTKSLRQRRKYNTCIHSAY